MVAQYNKYAYTYDAAGNIVEITGMDAGISAETADGAIAISVSMTYDEDNRLLSYNNKQVEYDANGNMIRGPLNGAMADFAYDCRNRLVKVTEADGTVTTYEYDAEDIRIASTTGNIRTEYTTDRQSTYSQTLIKSEYEKSNLGIVTKLKSTTTYTYGLGLLSERRDAGEQYYYHYNHIGSTMAVSDGSGEVLYRFVYDTYGELSDIRTSDNISLRTLEEANYYTLEELAYAAGFTYLYNGQYGVATDQNGLYYMRARYYDQDIKRFINRDIISGDIGNSKSLNRYAYVQGNPVSLTDPFGLCPDSNSSVRLVRTFLCDTDWSTVGHTALDIVGIFWDGADVINAFWYAAEGNTEMAIASAVYALPGIGMASGRLMMCSDKLYKAGKAVYRASKLTQGCYGVIAGLTMAGAGISNIYNSLKNGEKISFKDIALAVGGIAIACFSGKTMVSDMKQMLGISNKMDRTIKVGNADISHEPVPSEKKILEAAESGRAARSGNAKNTRYGETTDNLQEIKGIMSQGEMSSNGRRIIYNADDNTRIIFGLDIGENAHPIRSAGYLEPVNHMNIVIQTVSEKGKVSTVWDMHLILDEHNNVIDTIITGPWRNK